MFEIDFSAASKMTPEQIHEYRTQTIAILKQNLEEKKKDPKFKNKFVEQEVEDFANSLNLMINLEKFNLSFYDFDLVQNIIDYSKKYNVPVNIYLTGGSKFKSSDKTQMLFTKQAISKLAKLNQALTANGMDEIKFVENPFYKTTAWTMSQVKLANQKIDEVVDIIKSKNLSPFEAIAFIHNLATRFIYKENPANSIISRGIVGITNTEYIVCVGYSSFVKAIVDKLNMKGLSCETLSSTLMDESDKNIPDDEKLPGVGDGHMQNLIHINDPKYNVSGTYVSDSCFDSASPKYPERKSFANFMFPVKDLLNYKDLSFDQPDDIIDFFESILGEVKEIDKSQLPVIKKFAKSSKPIPLETLKTCLLSMFKKVYPNHDEKHIRAFVNKIIEDSKEVSRTTFNENATNAFAVTSHNQKMLN